jgi:hypothetical protein
MEAMTLESMAYLKNNEGNALRYYLCSAVDLYLFTYSMFSIGDIVFIYIINMYIPLMDRVNSMVMVEKLKCILAEELKHTLAQSKSIRKCVGTKNQVESFLVIRDSD